jgi:hypothetical protein
MLRRHPEFDGVDRTAELSQNAISGKVDEGASKTQDQLRDGGLMCLQRLRRADFIPSHETRKACHVDRNDGGEASC